MAARNLAKLLESAAPVPTMALDIAAIERRARGRRHRRQGELAAASLVVLGLLIGLAALFSGPGRRNAVIAGPQSSSGPSSCGRGGHHHHGRRPS